MDASKKLRSNLKLDLIGEYLERGENDRSYWKAAMQVILF